MVSTGGLTRQEIYDRKRAEFAQRQGGAPPQGSDALHGFADIGGGGGYEKPRGI